MLLIIRCECGKVITGDSHQDFDYEYLEVEVESCPNCQDRAKLAVIE